MKGSIRLLADHFALVLVMALVALAPDAVRAQVMEVTVQIKGMACPFCAFGVEKKLKKVPGVAGIQVDIKNGTALLKASPGKSIAVDGVPKAVKDAGFTPTAITVVVAGRITSDSGTGLILQPGDSAGPYRLEDPGNFAARYRNGDHQVWVTGSISWPKTGSSPTIRVEKVKPIQ